MRKPYKFLNVLIIMAKTFTVVIAQDEDGVFVGRVPELKGCITQGATLDELMKNVKEAAELCLEVEAEKKGKIADEQLKFIGVQQFEVA